MELRAVANDLRLSWSHHATGLFRRLDSDLRESTGHNPVRMLGLADRATLAAAAPDAGFRARLQQTQRLRGQADQVAVHVVEAQPRGYELPHVGAPHPSCREIVTTVRAGIVVPFPCYSLLAARPWPASGLCELSQRDHEPLWRLPWLSRWPDF